MWCAKARVLFKQYNISYKDIDVGANTKAAQEMIKKSGQQGVPVFDIGGDILVGYDEDILKKKLHIT